MMRTELLVYQDGAEDCKKKFMAMNDYRIYRVNSLNIAIQKQALAGEWITQSYHGNSLLSLVSGLLELAVAKHVPKGDTLSEQLETMKIEVALSVKELENMVSEYCGNLTPK